MRLTSILTVTVLCISMTSSAWAYDKKMAKSYEELFSSVDGATAGKALHFITPESLAKDISAGKNLAAIDVRTPGETAVYTLTLPNSMAIPANKIFKTENLKRIPKDKPVIIICKSGARGTAIGTSLRHIGFDNVYILKGGFQALSAYYGPKQAYEKQK